VNCPQCGIKNIKNANFCESCGITLDNLKKDKRDISSMLKQKMNTLRNFIRIKRKPIAITLVVLCFILLIGNNIQMSNKINQLEQDVYDGGELESRVGDLEDKSTATEDDLDELKSKVDEVEDRVNNLEYYR